MYNIYVPLNNKNNPCSELGVLKSKTFLKSTRSSPNGKVTFKIRYGPILVFPILLSHIQFVHKSMSHFEKQT